MIIAAGRLLVAAQHRKYAALINDLTKI
jgi:hypothetical protein